MKNVRIGVVVALGAMLLLASCGDDGGPKIIAVTVSPHQTTMDQGATRQFTATVTGSSNNAVVWSLMEGATGGSIDANGLYKAPAASGVYHVLATSTADSTKKDSAEISVKTIAMSLSPDVADMEPGATQQFTATVTGTVNHDVTWSVQEASGGSITADGMYTAPATTGRFHVVATSVADKTQSLNVEITVTNLAVIINPKGVGLLPGSTRTFTASVSGCMDDRVTWAVQEGNAGGTITAAGLYQAPTTLGQYHVIATSVAHPSVSRSAIVSVGQSGWSAAGDMTQVRTYHTATLLANGDVLLAGGGYIGTDQYWHNTQSAELFDHTTGKFRSTGSMVTGREGHTATLLKNGKVLIAGGGYGGWASVNSAELYDPPAGTFIATGNMLARRTNHTATLLRNGKVLIVGGDDGWLSETPNPLDPAIAELYDPESGTFSVTGRTSIGLLQHTATLLQDGRVLVTGGADWGGACSNGAETYDPATGEFSPAGSLDRERESHSATLLMNGNVLVAGGQNFSADSYYPLEPFDDAQLFYPARNQFGSSIEMNAQHSQHTATLLQNGQVLLTGGYAATIGSLYDPFPDSVAELYDPANSTFILTGSMSKARAGHTATLLPDGRVLVTGGSNDKSAELYTYEK